MKFVVCGAGSAGLGVISWLAKAMMKHGLAPEEAYANFYIIGQSRPLMIIVARLCHAVLPAAISLHVLDCVCIAHDRQGWADHSRT